MAKAYSRKNKQFWFPQNIAMDIINKQLGKVIMKL